MQNLQLSARQIMMICQQLKMAMDQDDTDMENKLMSQLKAIADDVVTNDKSWQRFIPYVTAIKGIYDVYESRSDYFNGCELAIESLLELTPLAEYINQEKPASMITLHLDMALWPMHQMHMSLVRQNVEHDISPITLLADLLHQNSHNLSQINPSNPLVGGLSRHITELDELGLVGTCGDMNLDLYPCIVLLRDLWEEAKSKYRDYNSNQSMYYTLQDDELLLKMLMDYAVRFGLPRNIQLNEKIDDMISAPLYKGLKEIINYDKILSDFYDIEPFNNAFSFARSFYNFSYYYEEYCKYRNISPSALSTLYIDEALPNCLSTKVLQLHEEAKQCFLSLDSAIGVQRKVLVEKFDNDEAMLDMAEISDEYLQPLITSMVEMNIEKEGVLIFNRDLTFKALKYEDESIADSINQVIENLKQCNLLTEVPSHYTEKDIKSILKDIQYPVGGVKF